MTTYNWSDLTNGQTLSTFNPASDVLNINDATLAATTISLSYSSQTSGSVSITLGGKTVTLNTPIHTLTTTNVTFSDGSLLLIGDNTTAIGGSGTNDNAANTLNGSSGGDTFYGFGGNDTLNGGDGNDSFYIGTSTGAVGNDQINGGAGTDGLYYSNSATSAVSVNLTGAVNSGIAAHTATNGQGTHTLDSIEIVFGGSGDDKFIGGDSAHAIDSQGNSITERFRGNTGNDTIIGGAGDGFFTVADYSNNSSTQAINANLATGVVSDGRLLADSITIGTDTLTNVDGIRGGAGNDSLVGGSQSRSASGFFFEFFRGNGGNDTINGNNGSTGGQRTSQDRADYSGNSSAQAVNVNLDSGTASDGLGGTDTLIDIDAVYGGAGNDTLTGGAENESFDGGAGNDAIDGGAGNDEARFQQSTAAVIVNLSLSSITVNSVTVDVLQANDGMGGTDNLSSIEGVTGSEYDDYIRGSDDDHRETFRGEGGNDTIDGGDGAEDFISYFSNAVVLGGINATLSGGTGVINDGQGGTDTVYNMEGIAGTNASDTLTGGAGTQWLRGNGGNDTLNGGADDDWVTYGADYAGVIVNLASGTASDGMGGVFGFGGTDTLISIEHVEGSDFNDSITGNGGANRIIGGDGVDSLDGGAGNDIIVWDASDNQAFILGGADFDTLYVEDAAIPTGFDLAAHGFEQANVVTLDPGGNWWREVSDYYNTSWQRTNSDTFADNGNIVQTTYDPTNAQNWQYISDYRNASNVLTNQDGKFDGGNSFAKSYDYAAGTGIDGISDELSEFTYFFANDTDRAANKVLNVEGFYDDGRKFTQTNDIGPGANGDYAWTFQTNWYETDGETLDFLEIRWDDGSTQIIPY